MAMRLNAEMKAQVVRRAMQYAETARAGGGEREKARRVKQMLEERLKAENGVERVFAQQQVNTNNMIDELTEFAKTGVYNQKGV